MFETEPIKRLRILVLIKWVCLPLLVVYLCLGMIAAYRAWYQVRSLELYSSDSILQDGSRVSTTLISYARTTIDVRIEMVQGSHTELISTRHLPGNDWAFFDPRNRQASQTTLLTLDVLKRFAPGKAQIRATAIGREQWTRLPPPVIREVVVEISAN
jgi:hypothetical protein